MLETLVENHWDGTSAAVCNVTVSGCEDGLGS